MQYFAATIKPDIEPQRERRLLATSKSGSRYVELNGGEIVKDGQLAFLPEHWRVFSRTVKNYPGLLIPTAEFYEFYNERTAAELARRKGARR